MGQRCAPLNTGNHHREVSTATINIAVIPHQHVRPGPYTTSRVVPTTVRASIDPAGGGFPQRLLDQSPLPVGLARIAYGLDLVASLVMGTISPESSCSSASP
jgi:hypothetical protein